MDNTHEHDELLAAVAACAADARVFGGLAEIFREVDERVRLAGAECLGCGCCCRFALAGHRLYVSTAELAVLLSVPPARTAGPLECPYQQGPACHARSRRPLGCRTFFCRASEADTADLYEAAHAQIRRLHEALGVPYFYRELTAAILMVQRRGDAETRGRGEDIG